MIDLFTWVIKCIFLKKRNWLYSFDLLIQTTSPIAIRLNHPNSEEMNTWKKNLGIIIFFLWIEEKHLQLILKWNHYFFVKIWMKEINRWILKKNKL